MTLLSEDEIATQDRCGYATEGAVSAARERGWTFSEGTYQETGRAYVMANWVDPLTGNGVCLHWAKDNPFLVGPDWYVFTLPREDLRALCERWQAAKVPA